MITLKANTQFKAVVINVDERPLVVTYAQAYTIAFNLLYLLGMVREVKDEDQPTAIELFLPDATPADEDRILDPNQELVPDLETVIARINRHPYHR